MCRLATSLINDSLTFSVKVKNCLAPLDSKSTFYRLVGVLPIGCVGSVFVFVLLYITLYPF